MSTTKYFSNGIGIDTNRYRKINTPKTTPKKGDYVKLDGENFTIVDQVENTQLGSSKIIDIDGEQFVISRYDYFDTDERKAWVAILK